MNGRASRPCDPIRMAETVVPLVSRRSNPSLPALIFAYRNLRLK